jgi:hypothetical protein
VSTVVPRLAGPVTSFQHSFIVSEQGTAAIWGHDANMRQEHHRPGSAPIGASRPARRRSRAGLPFVMPVVNRLELLVDRGDDWSALKVRILIDGEEAFACPSADCQAGN